MARLGRGGIAELGRQESDRGGERRRGRSDGRGTGSAATAAALQSREDQHADQRQGEAGREVPGDVSEVVEDRERADEPLPAAADPDVEASREDRSEYQNGTPRTATVTRAPDRLRVLARARTNRHWDASTSAPYGCVAITARIATTQSAQRRRPPCSTATRKRQVRKRARKQEERVHAAVDPVEKKHPARRDERRRDSAAARPPRRAQRAAITGTLATAKSAEKQAKRPRPPPRCATSQAKRKWSGAPPRSRCTV